MAARFFVYKEDIPLIELKNVTKDFGAGENQIHAVRDISLTIADGEIFGIIGLSGAGKSTLVRCLNLLERPTSGSVIVDGQDLTSLPKKDLLLIRRSIGMIFQGFNLLEQRSILRNVCYPLEIAGWKKDEAKARARELLALVGLADREKAYPSQLSGGQKQRVAIARALATRPRYILCDEATSALDPTTTQSILALLKEINRTMGVTIVVITHEMRVIDQICDRVAVIDHGSLAEIGAVSQVFTNPQSDIARELILPGSKETPKFTPGGRRLRIAFDGESTRAPIISSLITECQVQVNIVFADIREIDGKTCGQMLLELPDDEIQAQRACLWLDTKGISYSKEV